jgi:hypothetical protein
MDEIGKLTKSPPWKRGVVETRDEINEVSMTLLDMMM